MDRLAPMDYATLGVKVAALEGDFAEVKDSIAGLDAKINRSISDLAHEVRAAITTLSSQFAERSRTPWGTIASLGGVVLVLVGAFLSQVLNPINTDINTLKANIVPRIEHDYRIKENDRHLAELERRLQGIEDRRYTEMLSSRDNLAKELMELKRGPK